MNDEFWKRKSLSDMSSQEWEFLCDGCAQCCVHKIEDEGTDEIFFTDISCRLLDSKTCRCTDYAGRAKKVANCLVLAADKPELYRWLPASCAYRLLAEGQDLPGWHPLKTGDPESVHEAGISVRGRVTSETESEEYSILWRLSE